MGVTSSAVGRTREPCIYSTVLYLHKGKAEEGQSIVSTTGTVQLWLLLLS